MPKAKGKNKNQIKAVLFDLGKVIVHFNFDPAFKRLSKASGVPVREIEDFFVSSGLEVPYDGGKISSRQFHQEIQKGLKHSISFEKFKKIWNEIFTPITGVIRIIQRLHGKKRLVLISNTNEMHFAYIRKKYPVIKKFNKLLLSYEEKMRKPDERFYAKAAKACLAKPQEILYIDDRLDFTQAADELGFHTFTFAGNVSKLEARMKKLGVL